MHVGLQATPCAAPGTGRRTTSVPSRHKWSAARVAWSYGTTVSCVPWMSRTGVFDEGAAACSYNLPFGTKLTIAGDPTGRVYECLDRGALANTWVDVYFEDTRDGMAWQSQLGGTVANITIVN